MPHSPDYTRGFARFRIRNPSLFKKDSFRTLDIGDVGKHKLIRGILKSTGEYKTQSVIVEKDYYKTSEGKKETRDIVARAKKE